LTRLPDNLPAMERSHADGIGELGPLPGGHHGLSREQIADSQRERLLGAIAEEVAEVGYRDVTIRGFTRRAGVSTRDFYEHFEGKEDCFLAAFEAVREHLERVLREAAAAAADWPRGVVAVLRAALEFFADEPELARLCLVEPVSATPTIAIHFREVVLGCAPVLAKGRERLADPGSLPPTTEDSLLGGIVSLASGKVLVGETGALPDLLPDLVEFALGPYLGAEDAAELAASAHTPS
jgi:AcrR family transcriptional regulator